MSWMVPVPLSGDNIPPMDLLALDIGNTRLGWRLTVAGRTLAAGRGEHAAAAAEAAAAVRGRRGVLPVACCVNPTDLDALMRPIADAAGRRVLLANADIPLPMPTRLDRPDRTGADRLAAALGAAAGVGCPAVVVTAGTAVTVNALSAEGVFLGGAILPGLRTQLWSLRQRTALLPEITVDAVPETAVGTDTDPAIRAGVYFGLVGAVTELAGRARRTIGAAAPVVATGGDAALLAEACPTITRVDDDLIFTGLAEWVRRAIAAGWRPPE
jgi:type III pantothenate kinase